MPLMHKRTLEIQWRVQLLYNTDQYETGFEEDR